MAARGRAKRKARAAPATEAPRKTHDSGELAPPTADRQALTALVAGLNGRPFELLGPHRVEIGGRAALAVRAFIPGAETVAVLERGRRHPMRRVHPAGFFEAVRPHANDAVPPRYRFAVTLPDGTRSFVDDPYRFPPLIADSDLELFRAGTHYQLQRVLGAHLREVDGVRGCAFAVWAPNALRVSVIGSFNRWDERRHPMRRRGAEGVWELFVPAVRPGDLYKFHIKTGPQLANSVKADPFGFAMQRRPETASIVCSVTPFRWSDAEWMATRQSRHAPGAPLAVYEVHLGSWRRHQNGDWLSYRELARQLIPYAKHLGYTHLELLPVAEHPFDGSWGYQTVGYFAPSSRFGTPDEFRAFVNAAHRAGLGVILDWVPAHFPRDGHGLAFFDGTHLFEHEDPRRGAHPDWGTYIFDYGRSEVVAFLLSNAHYWLDAFHLDGLRVDAVASMLYLDYSRQQGEWVPNRYGGRENLEAVAFVRRFNELLHRDYPDALTIAEESTAWPGVSRPVAAGGLGFDLKWNLGWMHDTLAYMKEEPQHRHAHHRKLTFSLLYAFSENFMLPFSHDEVVHGKRSLLMKMPGDRWRKFANLRVLYGYMYAHPGKKLLFMGGEFGQLREWNHDRQLDWDLLAEESHRGLQHWVRDLNRLYVAQPALHGLDFRPDGFRWIDCDDAARSVVSLLRQGTRGEQALAIANFTPSPQTDYRIGVPVAGKYRLLLNSDALRYGGSGFAIAPSVHSEPLPYHDFSHSLQLTLPPLGIIFLAVPAQDSHLALSSPRTRRSRSVRSPAK